MKKPILMLSLGLLMSISNAVMAADSLQNESSQIRNMDDPAWKIGGKIHFEEESGSDYIGIKEINRLTRHILKNTLDVKSDDCFSNAKILLKKETNEIMMTHYEEKSKPGIGEEMHATLLYTQPRGFCSSETLKQVCGDLFEQCDAPPSIESVVKRYSAIIKPKWKFKISEVVLTTSQPTGASFIIAELLFEDCKNIYQGTKPISAGLHMALVISVDDSILTSKEISDQLIQELNKALKGKLMKVALKNGVADLEFGMSGSSWRIRAEERSK